jgi:nicotinamide-nucleotide amidase
MRQMWTETVAPTLARLRGGPSVIRHRRLKCFGVGESDLEQMLPDLIRRGRVPAVGITVHKATITLRITAAGETDEACGAAMEPTVATIRECLGELVFGEEQDELHDVVARLLKERGETLATVECVTGAVISRWLRESPEAAHSYRGGYVVSSPEWIRHFSAIDVAQAPLSEPQAAEITAAMASHLREQMGTDYALATGPLAYQPLPDQPPRFQIALATANGVSHKSHVFAGHPDILLEWSAKHALNFLRMHLVAQTPRTSGR